MFPPRQELEISNIIGFPFIQSVRSEDFLRQKYLEERLSLKEIGELTFSSTRTVLAWMRRFKIVIRADEIPKQRGLRFGERRVGSKIIDHPKEQKAIALMKDLRSKGYSYPQLVEVLNSMGVRSKSGGKWHLKTVFEVLNRKI